MAIDGWTYQSARSYDSGANGHVVIQVVGTLYQIALFSPIVDLSRSNVVADDLIVSSRLAVWQAARQVRSAS